MLRNVFSKTVWDLRRSLLGWGIGFGLVTLLYAAYYPTLRSSDVNALLDSYPQALKEAFNLTDFSSAAGYLNSSVFTILAPLLMLVFSAAVGARAIAGDEEAGTLELQLAHPLSRISLLLQRFAALFAALVVAAAAVLVALLVISGPADLGIGIGKLAAMCLHLLLLGLCFGTLALVVGAWAGRRSLVLAVTATIGAATYIANSFLAQIDALAWTRRLSPFHWYGAGEPLRNGIQLAGAGVLLAISLVLLAAGAVAFNRRDIAV
ncbi:MAG TPA: ABC transporter permease subunit [Actinomycetes bacterium]|nr:ABC transporter permease subunit [Actinomycetes bacterium]